MVDADTPARASAAANARKIAILAALYIGQGVPFGFQATALPVQLREAGASLQMLGFASLLALPWALKPLWSPWVDAVDLLGLGRRRSWLVAMQALQVVTCLVASQLDPSQHTAALLGCVLAMNIWAATQDIATDGFAVDLLRPNELGWGNSAQVVGYKIGMMTGGGLLVWLAGRAGWAALFVGMAVIQLGCLIVAATATGERHRDPRGHGPGAADARSVRRRVAVREVLATLLRVVKARPARPLLLLIGSYKLGESMIDMLFKPMLVDAGIGASAIGMWVGTVGMGAGLLGSAFGGWLFASQGASRALATTLVLRALPLGMTLAIAVFGVNESTLAVVTALEHAAGGALTTTIFAWMMASVDRRIGASHYTALAAIEVLGKAPGPWIAGAVAEATGYVPVIAAGLLLSLLPLGIVPFLPTPRGANEDDAADDAADDAEDDAADADTRA